MKTTTTTNKGATTMTNQEMVDRDIIKEQADTIIAQLGGYRRLAMMTGAKNFVYGGTDNDEAYIQFRIGRNAKRINLVKITLNADDTYAMEFMWATVNAITVKAEFSGVYNDTLKKIFESTTGLYLSFR